MCNVCIPEKVGQQLQALSTSGIARTFPGGQAAHPEDQIEEENEEILRKK